MSLRLPLRPRPSLALPHLASPRTHRLLFQPPSPTTLSASLRAAHSLPADLSSLSSSSSSSSIIHPGTASASPKTPSPKPKSYGRHSLAQPEVEVFAGPSRRRSFATATEFERMPSRPPPPPPSQKQPEVETFSAPSKPRAYYARPERDLPRLQVSFVCVVWAGHGRRASVASSLVKDAAGNYGAHQ